MKTKITLLLSLLFITSSYNKAMSQCADSNNIYSFIYNGNFYEVVKENKTWIDAAACAVQRGGHLVEINDSLEQNGIYTELLSAGITNSNTVSPGGGNASYLWIGANDLSYEGNWIVDGANDSVGPMFWQGLVGGSQIGGLYSNWGVREPDNSANRQDVAGIALTQWPISSGSFGSASEWNDLDKRDTLYYIIEYVGVAGVKELKKENKSFGVFPNPSSSKITLDVKEEIKGIKIVSIYGQLVLDSKTNSKTIDISTYDNGMYIIQIETEKGTKISRFIKQ